MRQRGGFADEWMNLTEDADTGVKVEKRDEADGGMVGCPETALLA